MIHPSDLIKCILSLLIFFPGIPEGNARAAPTPEQLLVFVQPDYSPVDRRFQEAILPRIRELAEGMGVSVAVLDSRKGSPP
ncbi:MAG: hypothetical protein ACOCWY_06975, partial [Thermodesulfobacteriota bacterium]